jgi:hypothetical protein
MVGKVGEHLGFGLFTEGMAEKANELMEKVDEKFSKTGEDLSKMRQSYKEHCK